LIDAETIVSSWQKYCKQKTSALFRGWKFKSLLLVFT
jgi:hypothetical protein